MEVKAQESYERPGRVGRECGWHLVARELQSKKASPPLGVFDQHLKIGTATKPILIFKAESSIKANRTKSGGGGNHVCTHCDCFRPRPMDLLALSSFLRSTIPMPLQQRQSRANHEYIPLPSLYHSSSVLRTAPSYHSCHQVDQSLCGQEVRACIIATTFSQQQHLKLTTQRASCGRVWWGDFSFQMSLTC